MLVDILAILPIDYGKSRYLSQVFSMSDMSTNSSVLVISPLNGIFLVKEQVMTVHLDSQQERMS